LHLTWFVVIYLDLLFAFISSKISLVVQRLQNSFEKQFQSLPGFEIARAREAGDPDGDGSEILCVDWIDIAEEDRDNEDTDPFFFGGSIGGGGRPRSVFNINC